MKTLIQFNLWFLLVLPAMSQPILNVDWNELAQKHELLGGQIISTRVSTGEVSTLKIENTNDAPLRLQLFEISNPAVTNLTYGFIGQIKSENVHGDGYLEMWNYFPPEKSGMSEKVYSSSDMIGSAHPTFEKPKGFPVQKNNITGTADWKNFIQTFDATGELKPPTKTGIGIFLPGSGTVYLRYVIFCQYKDNGSFPVASNDWWSSKQSGMIGGIGGSIIGCFGALVGLLAGKGRARRFVLAITKIFIVLGILLTIAGLAAVMLKQPYAVWYALLLSGIIVTSVFGANLRIIQKRYDDLEIRRMASIDAMGN
ncbi:MAG TPA: hypothetical protein VGM58_02580 [Verrucomicrobiae bacterium]|jgi:hypothetical protein